MKKYLSLEQIEKVAKDLGIKIEWSGDEKANEIELKLKEFENELIKIL